MSKSFKMDQNLYEKCVIYIQVHSGEDVKIDHFGYYYGEDVNIYLILFCLLNKYKPTCV